MVTSAAELLSIVRSNPFIDGIGYFVEITTRESMPPEAAKELTERMQDDFCAHAQVTLEGDDVVGLDFHEHIFTQGEEGEEDLKALERVLGRIEEKFGIEHLCIEFQFDMGRARKAQRQIDELLKP